MSNLKKFYISCEMYLYPRLEKLGFKAIKKDLSFVRSSNGIYQTISFDIAGYGSRVEILINQVVLESLEEPLYSFDLFTNGLYFGKIENLEWKLAKNITIEQYINYQKTIYQVIENYIIPLFSIFHNADDYFAYIFERKPRHKNLEEYINYQKIVMEKNKPLIKEFKQEYTIVDLNNDKILPMLSAKEFYKQSSKTLIPAIEDLGFIFDKKKILFSQKIIFLSRDGKFKLIGNLDYGLFLSFELFDSSDNLLKEIVQYSTGIFSHGWLIANTETLNENFQNIIVNLRNVLSNLRVR